MVEIVVTERETSSSIEPQSLIPSEVKWSEVTQLCQTLCDPMDCSLPSSSIHGIFQAIVLEWVAISYLPANTGDIREMVSIIGSGRSFGGGQGNPLQYACLENTMDRGAWRVTIHWVAKSQIWLKWLSAHKGFPGGPSDKESTCRCRSLRRCRFDPCVWKIIWRKK